MDKMLFFPAPVEAVKVTPVNLEEVASWCGGRVCTLERKTQPGVFDDYVWVPTPKGSSVFAAYPGMYVTRRVSVNTKGSFKDSWAVFHRDYFEKNYFQNPVVAIAQVWPKRVDEVLLSGGVQPGST